MLIVLMEINRWGDFTSERIQVRNAWVPIAQFSLKIGLKCL